MAIFTNQASLSYRNITRNSNIATGQIIETISASKTAVTSQYTPGDNVTYVISILNAGTTPQTGVSITDNLGAYSAGNTTVYPLSYTDGSAKYYVNGVLQSGVTATAGPPLVISGITIPAQGNATIIYEATVTDSSPVFVGAEITNTAVISGAGISTSVTASATIQAASISDLTISKSISPAIVTENDRVTYTFIVQNTGNAPAGVEDNVIINDTFNPILADITVTLNSTVLTEGTGYTYDETTGAFSTVSGIITVPAATFTQDPVTGVITTTPGVSVVTVEGTI